MRHILVSKNYHICKVNAFAKHVTGDGSLGRGNPKSLRENSGKIRGTRAMPQ